MGDGSISLNGRRRLPGICPGQTHDVVGGGESPIGIAVRKLPVMHQVTAHIFMEYWGFLRQGRFGFDDRLQRLVIDLDSL